MRATVRLLLALGLVAGLSACDPYATSGDGGGMDHGTASGY